MPRILLIDDDEHVRRSTKRLLQRAGYEVMEAAHGQMGLQLWRQHGADVVITDVCMPSRDGIEVIVELHSLAPTLAIIAMSGGAGSSSLDLLGTAHQVGALRTVPKPFTAGELLATVREVLEPGPALPDS
jgi:DNA-binding NtrC family response regulator